MVNQFIKKNFLITINENDAIKSYKKKKKNKKIKIKKKL